MTWSSHWSTLAKREFFISKQFQHPTHVLSILITALINLIVHSFHGLLVAPQTKLFKVQLGLSVSLNVANNLTQFKHLSFMFVTKTWKQSNWEWLLKKLATTQLKILHFKTTQLQETKSKSTLRQSQAVS